MGGCQSEQKEKPVELVEAKDARDVVDQYNKYQSIGIQKEKLEFRYVYAFKFKNELYEVVKVYLEPVKIPDFRYQSDTRDDWEKILIKKVNQSDYQAQPEQQSQANPKEVQSNENDGDEEDDYLLMMNLLNQNTALVHEKQVRFFEKLKHPNLVEYMDHYRINNQLTAFKEYCPQGGLIKYLERNKKELNADILFDLIEDVCNALKFLYDRAVVDFELSLEMIYVSNNIIKIDLYNGVKMDEKVIRRLLNEGHKSDSQVFNNLILNSRVQMPTHQFKPVQTAQSTLKTSQKTRIVIDDQAQFVEQIQKKFKVDENKINIDFVRLFCLYILFDQDFRVMLKEKQAIPNTRQFSNKGQTQTMAYKEIDVSEIKEVNKAPKDLKEFMQWTLNQIKSIRPNLTELHKEIQRIRYQADVITYINQLYIRNASKKQSNQSELPGDEKLKGYQSHYLHTTMYDDCKQNDDDEDFNEQKDELHESSTNAKQIIFNRHLIKKSAAQKIEQEEESVQNQLNNSIQNSLNIDTVSFNNNHDSVDKQQKKNVKIWEEVEEIPQNQIKKIINPTDLMNVQFKFYEENYYVASLINKSEYGLGFRIENVIKSQPRALCLKISKSKSYNPFLEKEFTILKQFGTPYIIKSYSQVHIKGLNGIVVDLYSQNLQQYLINSSKLDIACQLIEFLHQFLSGLHELHVKDIIHRQLSFESICIQSPSSSAQNKTIAKISNLELAIQLKSQNYISSDIPLNSYSSPEMREKQAYGIASDVFSAGVIILSALCNVSPKKIQSIACPDLLPQGKQNLYVSHIVDQKVDLQQSHYQRVFSKIQKKQPKDEQRKIGTSETKGTTESNIFKSHSILVDSSPSQSKNQSKNEIELQQSAMNSQRVQTSRQNINQKGLREVLGEKCPQLIIDTFEKMISKYPQIRGNCSDYLSDLQRLKNQPEVINYVNMQNKQTRLI
ncbi:protein kinase (macronuclear) [Tetrahymena thermophila SB210]|uniref:Protein kinase n=1 Tax=Tetrahymena thermophila (strain SB210) TaxID=312017 RepID=Q24DA7_TETTS|nr:protein kinase [Tetrahymena thermophila SB210]EAS05738.3 protein kinase [Tetrahymena thermophila SB210]|eukprot:XP_001025983.3 protein kinase [Tetrahymena thermophila SB210]